jgi:hypothetical protein
MSWMASIFESRAAAERSLTTKLFMPPGVCDGATSPEAGRRAGRAAAGFAATRLAVPGLVVVPVVGAAGAGFRVVVFVAIQVSWSLCSSNS